MQNFAELDQNVVIPTEAEESLAFNVWAKTPSFYHGPICDVMTSNEDIVKKLWTLFDARQFADVRPLLHDEFVCVWPQSRELIRGADNFIAVNENYPGAWKVNLLRIVSSGSTVISEVELTFKGETVYAVSFFEFSSGKIVKATEYWGDCYAAPAWRSTWVETQ